MSQRRSGRPASSPTSKVETGTVLVEPRCELKGSVDSEARRVRAHTRRGPRKRRCGSRLRVGREAIRCGPQSSEGRDDKSLRAQIGRRTAREPHRKQIPSTWIARQSLMRAPGIRPRRRHGERPPELAPEPPTAIPTQRELKQEKKLTPNAGRTKNKFYSRVKSNKNNNSITKCIPRYARSLREELAFKSLDHRIIRYRMRALSRDRGRI